MIDPGLNFFIKELVHYLKVEKVKELIEKDLDLVEYVKSKYGVWMGIVMGFLAGKPHLLQQLKNITTSDLLKMIKETRPDIYKVLETDKGKKWIEKQDLSKFFQF
ncbi:MAG: hypothetical protein B6D55_02275 [Candidatus Omnitrophica bacterium 4484_70.2]|nr:MAG: hypothetical protein B6D55_02275 [Candidatus Omnitrophica bacterium 4484_70.2]